MGRNQAGGHRDASNLGSNLTEFEVNLGTKKPGEHLPFEHVFDPEGATPPSMF